MGYMNPGTSGIIGENSYVPEEPEEKPAAKMRGLGDLVHKVFEKVGVVKAVKKVSGGRDCGCARRQDALNRAVPFHRKPSDSETGGAT
jgi:hypothetical protein